MALSRYIMTKEKIFITGATGMVGSHLVDYLLRETHSQIFALLRWRSPLENLVDAFEVNSKFPKSRLNLCYGDLLDPESLNRVIKEIKPDKVFHLAAQSFPTASLQMPSLTYETNVIGTSNLLESLCQHAPSAKILVCSSSEIFGKVPRDQIPIREDCLFHPASPYAISKVGTDLVGRYYAEAHGMQTVITRMFTHTGPRRGDYFAESTFAKQIAMIEAGIQGPVIKVGNLKSLRTIADVRDAVRAYVMLCDSDFIPGDVFNIGGNKVVTVEEILSFLTSLSSVQGIRIEADRERFRPIDADLQVPCLDKFRAYCGWFPEIAFETTMLDLLNYWRERIHANKFPRLPR
jgi:GDP-mannose 4,6-dehydratase